MELKTGRELLDKAESVSERVLPDTSVVGCNRIHQDLQNHRSSFNGLRSQVDSAYESLDNCRKTWNSYHESYDSFTLWLSKISSSLYDSEKLKSTVAEKQEAYEKSQVQSVLGGLYRAI